MLPVTSPVTAPTNDVAVSAPDEELKVRLVPLLGAKSPVAAVANSGKQVVSLDSSATVTCVAAPDKAPSNVTAVIIPVCPAYTPLPATTTRPVAVAIPTKPTLPVELTSSL